MNNSFFVGEGLCLSRFALPLEELLYQLRCFRDGTVNGKRDCCINHWRCNNSKEIRYLPTTIYLSPVSDLSSFSFLSLTITSFNTFPVLPAGPSLLDTARYISPSRSCPNPFK